VVDIKKLKKFTELPVPFNRHLSTLIEETIDEYDECRGYIKNALDRYGEYAFKDAKIYTEVGYDIQNEDLPESFEEKLLAVLAQMKGEYCNGSHTEKISCKV